MKGMSKRKKIRSKKIFLDDAFLNSLEETSVDQELQLQPAIEGHDGSVTQANDLKPNVETVERAGETKINSCATGHVKDAIPPQQPANTYVKIEDSEFFHQCLGFESLETLINNEVSSIITEQHSAAMTIGFHRQPAAPGGNHVDTTNTVLIQPSRPIAPSNGYIQSDCRQNSSDGLREQNQDAMLPSHSSCQEILARNENISSGNANNASTSGASGKTQRESRQAQAGERNGDPMSYTNEVVSSTVGRGGGGGRARTSSASSSSYLSIIDQPDQSPDQGQKQGLYKDSNSSNININYDPQSAESTAVEKVDTARSSERLSSENRCSRGDEINKQEPSDVFADKSNTFLQEHPRQLGAEEPSKDVSSPSLGLGLSGSVVSGSQGHEKPCNRFENLDEVKTDAVTLHQHWSVDKSTSLPSVNVGAPGLVFPGGGRGAGAAGPDQPPAATLYIPHHLQTCSDHMTKRPTALQLPHRPPQQLRLKRDIDMEHHSEDDESTIPGDRRGGDTDHPHLHIVSSTGGEGDQQGLHVDSDLSPSESCLAALDAEFFQAYVHDFTLDSTHTVASKTEVDAKKERNNNRAAEQEPPTSVVPRNKNFDRHNQRALPSATAVATGDGEFGFYDSSSHPALSSADEYKDAEEEEEMYSSSSLNSSGIGDQPPHHGDRQRRRHKSDHYSQRGTTSYVPLAFMDSNSETDGCSIDVSKEDLQQESQVKVIKDASRLIVTSSGGSPPVKRGREKKSRREKAQQPPPPPAPPAKPKAAEHTCTTNDIMSCKRCRENREAYLAFAEAHLGGVTGGVSLEPPSYGSVEGSDASVGVNNKPSHEKHDRGQGSGHSPAAPASPATYKPSSVPLNRLDFVTNQIQRVRIDENERVYVIGDSRDNSPSVSGGVGQGAPPNHLAEDMPHPRISVTNEIDYRKMLSSYQDTINRFVVVVAIDFGTTYSGYAYSFTRDPYNIHIMRKWEGGDPGVVNMKVPTVLLLTPNEEFHSFGFAARDFYHDLEPKEARSWLYLDKFKMALHYSSDLNINTTLTATCGQEVRALKVFSYAIRFFFEHALQELSDQLDQPIEPNDVRWILTVPAIWRQPAKQFMREAATLAGMVSTDDPNQLLIALEPEAASIYIRKLRLNQLVPEKYVPKPLNPFPNKSLDPPDPDANIPAVEDLHFGTRYMVVDCGGGTVDITVHELAHDGSLKELYKASGGPHGSIGVDMEFENLMCLIFGEDFMDSYRVKRPAGYVDLMIAFESRKRYAAPYKANPLNISLPFSFIDYFKKTRGYHVDYAIRKYNKEDKEVTYSSQGMLRLSPAAMRSLFEPVLLAITASIRAVLEHPNCRGIKFLFLVGGFAESALLQQEMREQFSSSQDGGGGSNNLRVIIPQDMSLTIVKGAVIFGLDPAVVMLRRSHLTYGVGILNRFVDSKHPKSKRIVKDGIAWCTDVFDKFVTVDQAVSLGDSVVRSYTPAKPGQKVSVISVYCSEREDIEFITDEGVRKCGTLCLDLRGIPDELLPRRREIRTSMEFGDTEIKISALDVTTGRCVLATIDFLNK